MEELKFARIHVGSSKVYTRKKVFLIISLDLQRFQIYLLQFFIQKVFFPITKKCIRKIFHYGN